MSGSYSVALGGPGPWGFRLQGGKDFNMPLTISRLTDGGKAARAHIAVGDVVLSIDGIPTSGMNHLEAQNKIKACSGNLNLSLRKASSVPKPASAPKDAPPEVHKPVAMTPLAPAPTTGPSSTYNKTARPFGGGGTCSVSAPKMAAIPSASSAFTPASSAHSPGPAPAQVPPPFTRSQAPPTSSANHSSGRSPFPPTSSSSSSSSSSSRVTGPPAAPVQSQPAVYNSPIHLYSGQKAGEVMGQRRGLQEGLGQSEQHNGSPRKPAVASESEFSSPSLSPGDASRRRLVEDTEDWHPRSGSTQSRSFRILAQITGTEQQDDQQGEEVKNEAEVQPGAHGSSPVKTMTKAPPAGRSRNGNAAGPAQGKPASWRPGQSAGSGPPPAAPSSSRGSSGAPSGRPGPPQPAGGQDTLVQRAEYMPAGTRTPLCGHCNQLIRGPFLVAMGKSWHPEEFTCAHCGASLAECGFTQEGGAVHCERCYEELFAPECARCHGKVLGEVINALKQTWHVDCFLCTSCKQPIRDRTFHLEEGQPYCERDYNSLFSTNCHGCDFPIEPGDQFLEALGWSWHDTCFVCAVCSTDLRGQGFYSKKEKPLCKKHAHTVNI
ncbi:PDZ and LIM domain protein 5-like isoform X1 [Conger conger]|uniref:PDZ and LIM domain protein 5-like isoform X1 n=1 Tax=Conger conger TaxID=82655 RepID=UPI002A5A30A6|nr:PDZ and LIM domain protein 5-like isoform X1 [Conger conger]